LTCLGSLPKISIKMLLMAERLKRIVVSRTGAVALLIMSTASDCWGTHATVGDKLYLDGNPFVRGLNWSQALILQAIVGTAIVVCYLVAWGKRREMYPSNGEMGLIRFTAQMLKGWMRLDIRWRTLRIEMIYAGLLLIWVAILAHSIAAAFIVSPLMGGPSWFDMARLLGVSDVRIAQLFYIILFGLVAPILLAHYPLYYMYCQDRKRSPAQEEQGTRE